MGFRSFHSFNLAMLAKNAWNFISNPNTLARRLIKAKYFSHGKFLSLNCDQTRALPGKVFGCHSSFSSKDADGISEMEVQLIYGMTLG